MAVIKKAFDEGRDTKTKWVNSEAKIDQLKFDLFTENTNNFNGRVFNSPIHIQRINPVNGDVLEHFATRLAAARWVCQNVLGIDHNDEKFETKAVSITGNMHMCISNGWKSYGFYWKYIDSKTFIESMKSTSVVPANAKAVFVKKIYMHDGMMYASVAEASRHTGVGIKRIRSGLKEKIGFRTGEYIFQYVNEEPKTIKFKTIAEGIRNTGLSGRMLTASIADSKPVNNYTYELENLVSVKTYVVLNGRKVILEFPSLRKMARHMQISDATAKEILNRNVKIKMIYRLGSRDSMVPRLKLKKK